MACRMVAILMTLSDLQGQLCAASVFKSEFLCSVQQFTDFNLHSASRCLSEIPELLVFII